jgi:hypothetical protein
VPQDVRLRCKRLYTPWISDPSLLHHPRALDLVAIGFAKPARFYGNTISSKEDLLSASAAFKAHYLQVRLRTGPGFPGGRSAPIPARLHNGPVQVHCFVRPLLPKPYPA